MHETSKGWNYRIKLAMGELEDKIQRESVHNKRRESWPRQEMVDAWTAERQRQRSSGQYCGSTAQEIAVTKEEKKRQSFVKSVCIQGVSRHLPDSITVSSSVGGRELPIYCVETDKKQVALSFDAAWGNEDTGRILETLKKHDVKVTFFMTGGWVESYPDDVKAILAAGD